MLIFSKYPGDIETELRKPLVYENGKLMTEAGGI